MRLEMDKDMYHILTKTEKIELLNFLARLYSKDNNVQCDYVESIERCGNIIIIFEDENLNITPLNDKQIN